MDYTIATLSGNYSQTSNAFDVKTIIESISAIGTFVVAVFAGFALRQSNKQLRIEQAPYIVLDHIRKVGNSIDLLKGSLEQKKTGIRGRSKP